MNEIVSSVNGSAIPSGYAAPANAAQENTQRMFQQLMTMMMTSSMGSMGSTDASSGGGQNLLMMPLMMLMEQLMAQQLQGDAAGAATLGGSVPSGQPVEGPVTQSSHNGHVALDFGVPVGTPVRATMSGQVVYAGWNHEGYGNLVIVENGPYRTYYAHLSELPVQVGQTVAAGSIIGLSGNTGNSTGPHVHYEIRVNEERIDPTTMTIL